MRDRLTRLCEGYNTFYLYWPFHPLLLLLRMQVQVASLVVYMVFYHYVLQVDVLLDEADMTRF